MNARFPSFRLDQALGLIGFLFVAGVLLVLGYRLTPPGGPPTVRSRLLQRTTLAEAPRPANLVLITIDGLRLDRIGVYDSPGSTLTRHIDALGRAGFRFEQVVTSSPSSLPAHIALMTGRTPALAGASSSIWGRLPAAYPTLAESLVGAGFRTAAFVGSGALGRSTGLARGFESFEAPSSSGVAYPLRVFSGRSASKVIAEARSWVDENFRTRFFLWVQLTDLLGPHRVPASYRRLHDNPYDAAVTFVDAELGRILDRLESLGVLENTIVVITSPHGAGLGEHAEMSAGALLYDSTVLVPMLMRVPQSSARARSIPEQVRSIDLLPTFFDLLGIDPEMTLEGTSLVPLLDPGGRLPVLPAVMTTGYLEALLGGSRLEAFRSHGWKYIDGLRPELYHLRRDPGEVRNLAASRPDRVEAMRRSLGEATGREVIGGGRQPPPDQAMVSLLETVLRDLRQGRSAAARTALGDLSVRISEERSSPEDHSRAAPPALLALLGAVIRAEGSPGDALLPFTSALTSLSGSRSAPAGNVLRGLLHAEIAACRRELAEPQRAIESYRQALEIIPDDSDVRAGLASLLLERGVVVESITEFRAALARAPGSAELQAGLGRALLLGGDPRSAAQVLEQAVQSSPSDPRPFFDLARASEALDHKAAAARAYREYLARADPLRSRDREIARERLRQLESNDGAVHDSEGA